MKDILVAFGTALLVFGLEGKKQKQNKIRNKINQDKK